jgi:hypothetical protein
MKTGDLLPHRAKAKSDFGRSSISIYRRFDATITTLLTSIAHNETMRDGGLVMHATIRSICISLLCIFIFNSTAGAASSKKAVSYKEFKNVSLKKCFSKKLLGQKIEKCINPGKIGGGVNGRASVLTFANQKTGEIGAVLVAEQNFVVQMFGKKATIGAVCTYNQSRSSGFSFFAGVQLSTPKIPKIGVVDILSAAISARSKTSQGAMKDVPPSASRSGGRLSSGYAGSVSESRFKALTSAAAAGCRLRYPDYKIFAGVKSVKVFKAGIEFSTAAVGWKINTTTGSASVRLKTSMKAIAKVGGEAIKVKVAGQTVKWDLPGYKFNNKQALTNNRISF